MGMGVRCVSVFAAADVAWRQVFGGGASSVAVVMAVSPSSSRKCGQ